MICVDRKRPIRIRESLSVDCATVQSVVLVYALFRIKGKGVVKLLLNDWISEVATRDNKFKIVPAPPGLLLDNWI